MFLERQWRRVQERGNGRYLQEHYYLPNGHGATHPQAERHGGADELVAGRDDALLKESGLDKAD